MLELLLRLVFGGVGFAGFSLKITGEMRLSFVNSKRVLFEDTNWMQGLVPCTVSRAESGNSKQ